MKRPAAAAGSPPMKRPASAKKSLAEKFADRLKKVELARRAPTPSWVKGPRPSDECIAVHRDNDPTDMTVRKLDLKDMLKSRSPSDYGWCEPGPPPVPDIFRSEEVDARGVRAVWANWPGIDISSGVVMYLHGGAGCTGHVFVEWCAHLSRALGKAVLTVDYRMAPEHPMPAATEDAVKVYRWLVEDQRVPPGKLAIYGTSSGGMLVILTLQEIVRRSLPVPACGVPVAAWAPNPNQRELWDVVVGTVDADGQSTGNNHDVHDAKYDVRAANYRGMPPLYVMVGGEEHVNDLSCSRQVAKLAADAGVRAELDIVQHTQHCPDGFLGFMPEATACVARAAKFIDDAMNSA